MRFANDFHSWLRHSWKSLANRLTRDPKIVIHSNSCIILYILQGYFIDIGENARLAQWTSYQICKIAGCASAGNAGNVFPAIDFKGNCQLAISACITAHAGSLTRDCGENFSGIPGTSATRNFMYLVRGPWHWSNQLRYRWHPTVPKHNKTLQSANRLHISDVYCNWFSKMSECSWAS